MAITRYEKTGAGSAKLLAGDERIDFALQYPLYALDPSLLDSTSFIVADYLAIALRAGNAPHELYLGLMAPNLVRRLNIGCD